VTVRRLDWRIRPSSDGPVVVAPEGHPNAQRNGGIFEHVLVMTELLGRPLVKTVAWARWFLEQYGDAFPE
jgi:hypothetical protein